MAISDGFCAGIAEWCDPVHTWKIWFHSIEIISNLIHSLILLIFIIEFAKML